MNKPFFLIFFALIFLSCTDNTNTLATYNNTIKIDTLSSLEMQQWYFKDIEQDTVPGVSLEKLYNNIINNKKGKDIIIAVLDKPININQHFLKELIWKNNKEIIANGIDDDDNGYIDDVYGWNFMGGNNDAVTSVQWISSLRFLHKYDSLFKNKKSSEIATDKLYLFENYLEATKNYERKLEEAKEDLEYSKMIENILVTSKAALKDYFPNEDYTLDDLDRLKKLHSKDSLLQKQILRRHNFMKYGFTEEYIENYVWEAENTIKKSLNREFSERQVQGDDPDNIHDIFYGNNNVDTLSQKFSHGTRVCGAIGFPLFHKYKENNPIKIMPVVISAFGNRHSKDIASAILYAVDNGAKVINMSFSVKFMVYEKEVRDAILYAEANDVIILRAGGNGNVDTDLENFIELPNDLGEDEKEFSSNFITVGSSTHNLGKDLKSNFSSYGKENIDIFAPGDSIYTTFPNNYLDYERGTSMSTAVTSSTAALLFSYYPTLTAAQVKQIIMDSGVEYTIPVAVPTEENPDQLIPFNELSKSGKILNAYNAFIMADSVVKATKKRK